MGATRLTMTECAKGTFDIDGELDEVTAMVPLTDTIILLGVSRHLPKSAWEDCMRLDNPKPLAMIKISEKPITCMMMFEIEYLLVGTDCEPVHDHDLQIWKVTVGSPMTFEKMNIEWQARFIANPEG